MNERIHYRRDQRDDNKDEALCGATQGKRDPEPPMTTDSKPGVSCWRCITLLLGRPLPAEPALAEHDRLKAVKSEGQDPTQLVGEFLNEFLPGENIHLCRISSDGEFYNVFESRELIAKFFGINENALEAEKMALLEYQRKLNAAQEWAQKEGRDALQRS